MSGYGRSTSAGGVPGPGTSSFRRATTYGSPVAAARSRAARLRARSDVTCTPFGPSPRPRPYEDGDGQGIRTSRGPLSS